MWLLDTGILLRYIALADPLCPIVRQAIRTLHARGVRMCTLAQNIVEFWNVCTRPASARGGYGLSVSQTDARVLLLERSFLILPESEAAFSEWRRLVVTAGVSGVQVHDARIVAAMLAHGIADILTLNPDDFKRYTGIVATPPEAV